MSKSSSFYHCFLITLFLVVIAAMGTTSSAFAPVRNHPFVASKMVRNHNGNGHGPRPSSGVTCTSSSSSLLMAHPMAVLSLAKASFLPKLMLLKDATGPIVSMLENPDAEAQLLLDVSHVFLDFTAFFKFENNSAFLNAQLVGRLSFILIAFLPGHAFHWEEMAIQLFFLGVTLRNMMPDEEPQVQQERESLFLPMQRFRFFGMATTFHITSSSSGENHEGIIETAAAIVPTSYNRTSHLPQEEPSLPKPLLHSLQKSLSQDNCDDDEEMPIVTWEEIEVEMTEQLSN